MNIDRNIFVLYELYFIWNGIFFDVLFNKSDYKGNKNEIFIMKFIYVNMYICK